MVPLISVVIPCYNSSQYLPEAVASVQAYSGPHSYEIIIVNDGSTDAATRTLLNKLSKEGCTVLEQENKGPAAARNKGVKWAQAEYILFLDSDNKISTSYIDRGIEVLKKHKEVGVVHGNAAFLGATNGPRFATKEFDLLEIMKSNYIDICSVVRKKAWEEVGGLDENRLLMGHEDWEFWISLYARNWKFHYVDEILFDYRIRENSLWLQKSDDELVKKVVYYVYTKHWNLFMNYHDQLYSYYRYYHNDRSRPFRTFLKYLYYNYFKKGK
ncbi:MAG: glycosyltransferase family 2 protein [Williamsia sp.]|nr:glycosyltransferase family 2 protein [Williamsia sp.]